MTRWALTSNHKLQNKFDNIQKISTRSTRNQVVTEENRNEGKILKTIFRSDLKNKMATKTNASFLPLALFLMTCSCLTQLNHPTKWMPFLSFNLWNRRNIMGKLQSVTLTRSRTQRRAALASE